MGHQNHKQKINHLVQLKTDNQALKQKVTSLEVELAKQKRLISKMERGSKLNLAGNKENSHPLGGGSSAVVGGGGADLRRKTMQPAAAAAAAAKSPLTSVNRMKRK